MDTRGVHILGELWGCPGRLLDDYNLVLRVLVEAAVKCGATVQDRCWTHFTPHGCSAAVLVSESHLSVHTWPERGYAAFDSYTCGDRCRPDLALAYVADSLAASHTHMVRIDRGNGGRPCLLT